MPVLRRVAVACLAIAIAVGCTPADTVEPPTSGTSPSSTIGDTTTTTDPPDGYGGEVVIGLSTPIATLNPFAPNAFGGRIAGNAVWALVYDIDPETWQRVPDAVTGLPSASGGIEVNDDGTMTVRYEVRKDLVWSDGTPITGEDVAFTAEAMSQMAKDGTGGVADVMASVVGTDAVDRIAFVTFAEPTLAFEDALWIILPKHALEGLDLVDGTDGSDWPSGGPFVVESFDPSDAVRFSRNQRYVGRDTDGGSLPYLDAITITGGGDEPTSPLPRFLLRRLDVAVVDPGAIERGSVVDAASDGAVLAGAPTPIIEHITFGFGEARSDVNDASLNDNRSYREAVARSIDRSAILDETGVPWYPETPGILVPRGPSAWDRYDLSVGEASGLVDGAAGDTTPLARLSTTGNGDFRIRIGDALTSRFAAIGVDYEPIYLDSVLFFGETLTEGSFDLGMWAWVSDGGFASQLGLLDLFDPTTVPPDGNYGRWAGGDLADRYAEIVAAAHSSVDAARFEDLMSEAEDILASELPIIPLFARGTEVAYWSDVVTGIVPNGSASDLTWNLETWQRVGE